jgi:hypothetical protein
MLSLPKYLSSRQAGKGNKVPGKIANNQIFHFETVYFTCLEHSYYPKKKHSRGNAFS